MKIINKYSKYVRVTQKELIFVGLNLILLIYSKNIVPYICFRMIYVIL